ncbi:MAG: hypothetical protein AAFO69_07225, partial [Bacteroidota bacterium]
MRPIKLNVLAVFIILCITSLSIQGQNASDLNFFDQVDDVVTKTMEEGDIPGLSLVIFKDGEQSIRSYGYADKAQDQPVLP